MIIFFFARIYQSHLISITWWIKIASISNICYKMPSDKDNTIIALWKKILIFKF